MHPIFNPSCQKTVQGVKKKEKRTEGRLSKRYLALDIEDYRSYEALFWQKCQKESLKVLGPLIYKEDSYSLKIVGFLKKGAEKL